jgi:alpha-L-fucosidase
MRVSKGISHSPRETDIAAFKRLKFGMFIHWGLYSELAGEWRGQQVPARRPNAEQIDLTFRIPNVEYERTANRFNPVLFNADTWVALAKKAGMRYLVFTAKHQDGFAMFRSTFNQYNIADATPFKRDPLKEIADACHRQGIALGICYSNARDYHEPGANWNTHGNTWDFPPQDSSDFAKYFYGKVFTQVRELLTNYGKVSVMWFDVPYKMPEKMSRDLKELVVSLQPDCVVNSRIGNGQGDFQSLGDNHIAEAKLDEARETCMTMNRTWGYSAIDHHYKPVDSLLRNLVTITARGGNYLLNVGPDGLGKITDESKAILSSIGDWLDLNGEAIYNSKPFALSYPHPGWECTMKPGVFFFHIMKAGLCELKITGLPGTVETAYVLAGKKKITFSQHADTLLLELPVYDAHVPQVIAVKLSDKK